MKNIFDIFKLLLSKLNKTARKFNKIRLLFSMFLKVESSSLRTNNRCCISVFYKLKTFCLCDSRYSGCSICVKIKVFRADLKLECLAPKSPNRGLKNVWLFGSSEVRVFGCLGVRVFNIQSINQKIKKSKNQTIKHPNSR